MQRKVQWGGVINDDSSSPLRPVPKKKAEPKKEPVPIQEPLPVVQGSYAYIYPNRPILVPADPKNPMNPSRDYLDELEKSGIWVAEKKWNGDNTLIYLEPNKAPVFWNRHREHLSYTPTPEVLEELSKWPKGTILNVETVHRHTKTVKNKLIVHCVMAWKGPLLTNKTWGDSRKILEDFSQGYGEHVILSETHKTGFWELFKQADGEIIEGIVLKNPKGLLVFSARPIKDVSYMRKIRVPSKKYAY